YYAAGVARVQALEQDGATFSPLGTVVVVPPWNFPLAIPAGGVLAALAAGNAVILKPAPESVATSAALAEACWAAGVPPDVLQLVPCADGEASKRLITDPGVDGAILTGSWDTARIFLGWRPSLALRAETSGKNAMVITATADLDLAIADLVHSAFGHAGQKCSAASLAILEASVYDDPRFRRQLADAVRTLRLGPGWHPTTTMGPLIRRPEGPLDRALRHLDGGETWLVQPAQVGGNPQLWSPGVKLGVQPGSHFHLTECFGPVLGIMRAANLEEATRWQDQPAYGLTAGLHSLDPAEIEWWTDSVRAGNLYVNRPITGAIVGRQPFGGWKRSVVGPGAKAGGPNYLLSLGTWTAPAPPSVDGFADAVARTWSQSMGPSDPAGLRAEANVFRYRRLKRVLVRAGHDVGDRDLDAVVAAAKAIGVAVEVSATRAREAPGARVETDHELVERLAETAGLDKLRLLGTAGDELRLAAHDAGLWVDDTPFSAHPGLEALRWAREQVVSQTLHRHGDVTGRFSSPRGHTVAS
ncbi:MAG: aldehyde dehydrogenase family protein, partial [Acidimicrobiales bacterium]